MNARALCILLAWTRVVLACCIRAYEPISQATSTPKWTVICPCDHVYLPYGGMHQPPPPPKWGTIMPSLPPTVLPFCASMVPHASTFCPFSFFLSHVFHNLCQMTFLDGNVSLKRQRSMRNSGETTRWRPRHHHMSFVFWCNQNHDQYSLCAPTCYRFRHPVHSLWHLEVKPSMSTLLS